MCKLCIGKPCVCEEPTVSVHGCVPALVHGCNYPTEPRVRAATDDMKTRTCGYVFTEFYLEEMPWFNGLL